MKTIGMDLDETLVDLQSKINKLFKKYKLQPANPVDWQFSNYPEKVRKDVFELFLNKKIMCNLKPFKYSKKLIKWLKKEGYKVVVITARDKSLKDDTIKFVKKTFNVDCYVVGPDTSKLSLMRKLDVKLWIDDSPKTLEYYQAGINCILMSNESTLYNHYLRTVGLLWSKSIKNLYDSRDLFKVLTE